MIGAPGGAHKIYKYFIRKNGIKVQIFKNFVVLVKDHFFQLVYGIYSKISR